MRIALLFVLLPANIITGVLALAVAKYQELRREPLTVPPHRRGPQDSTFVPPLIAERVRRFNQTPDIGRPVTGKPIQALDNALRQELRREPLTVPPHRRGPQGSTFVPPLIAERVRRFNQTPDIGRPVTGKPIQVLDKALRHSPRFPDPLKSPPSINDPSTRLRIKPPSIGGI